jgi:hypothetical protein
MWVSRAARPLPPSPSHHKNSRRPRRTKINSSNHPQKQPKIRMSTPHRPPNLTNPASPLPISLSATWHIYPHPQTTMELAPHPTLTARPMPKVKSPCTPRVKSLDRGMLPHKFPGYKELHPKNPPLAEDTFTPNRCDYNHLRRINTIEGGGGGGYPYTARR